MQVLTCELPRYRKREQFSGNLLYYEVVHYTIMQDISHIKFASIVVVIEVVVRTLLFPNAVG